MGRESELRGRLPLGRRLKGRGDLGRDFSYRMISGAVVVRLNRVVEERMIGAAGILKDFCRQVSLYTGRLRGKARALNIPISFRNNI